MHYHKLLFIFSHFTKKRQKIYCVFIICWFLCRACLFYIHHFLFAHNVIKYFINFWRNTGLSHVWVFVTFLFSFYGNSQLFCVFLCVFCLGFFVCLFVCLFFQSLIGIYFPISSILWTDIIGLYMYCSIRGHTWVDVRKALRIFHLFAWYVEIHIFSKNNKKRPIFATHKKTKNI